MKPQPERRRRLYVCPRCGSHRIQGMWWVDLNHDTIRDEAGDALFCPDCEDNGDQGYDCGCEVLLVADDDPRLSPPVPEGPP